MPFFEPGDYGFGIAFCLFGRRILQNSHLFEKQKKGAPRDDKRKIHVFLHARQTVALFPFFQKYGVAVQDEPVDRSADAGHGFLINSSGFLRDLERIDVLLANTHQKSFNQLYKVSFGYVKQKDSSLSTPLCAHTDKFGDPFVRIVFFLAIQDTF